MFLGQYGLRAPAGPHYRRSAECPPSCRAVPSRPPAPAPPCHPRRPSVAAPARTRSVAGGLGCALIHHVARYSPRWRPRKPRRASSCRPQPCSTATRAGFPRPERPIDCGEHIFPAHEMGRYMHRNVRDGDSLSRKHNRLGRSALFQKFPQADACRLLCHPEELATPDMVRKHRQPSRLDHDEKDKPRLATRRPPECRITLEGRKWGLEISVGDDADGSAASRRFHPGIDVAAAVDLPFMDVPRDRARSPWRSVSPGAVLAR